MVRSENKRNASRVIRRDAALLEGFMVSVRFAGERQGVDPLRIGRGHLSSCAQAHDAVRPDWLDLEDAWETAALINGLA